MRIGYLVHNLTDAAVAKRVAMLTRAGAQVIVIGFCRDRPAPTTVAGAPAVCLGQTFDANLGQRARAVLGNMLRPGFWRQHLAGCDVIMARNLEMLLLAKCAARFAGIGRLVYESLDIHRSLLGSGVANRILRALERWLVARSRLLIYSSPAFWAHYFAPIQHIGIPHLLVENRLFAPDDANLRPQPAPLPAAAPWTIGWFGNLRCRTTLERLRHIADLGQGRIRILIAGKPSPAEFPDFAAQIGHPQIRFHGAYAPADLPALYGQCHFAWSIDYFEAGLNSTWLLPNRIYEAIAHGAVPIALASVETGRWLERHGAGLCLPDALSDAELLARLDGLTPDTFATLREQVAAIPDHAIIATPRDCADLLNRIATA